VTVTSDKLRAKGPLDRQAAPAQAQSEAEFEQLFEENYPRIYAVLLRLLGDRAEAEDLTLETFWRLYRRPPRRQRNLGGWLYRVATNLGLNALRAWKRRQQYEQEAGRWEQAQPEPGPEEATAAREERRRVRQVLRRINPRQAQLLVLRHSGLSYQEVAEAVGVAPASVGTLLARAEQEFERAYRQEERREE
jgi:RNA polymerase sigma-70 factor, ECF subfamily